MYRKVVIAASVASLAFLGTALAQSGPGTSDTRPSQGECAGPPPNPSQCDEIRSLEMTDTTFEGEVVVGMTVPDTVILMDVPNYTTYQAAMIGGKRVFVDPSNRTVVEIVE